MHLLRFVNTGKETSTQALALSSPVANELHETPSKLSSYNISSNLSKSNNDQSSDAQSRIFRRLASLERDICSQTLPGMFMIQALDLGNVFFLVACDFDVLWRTLFCEKYHKNCGNLRIHPGSLQTHNFYHISGRGSSNTYSHEWPYWLVDSISRGNGQSYSLFLVLNVLGKYRLQFSMQFFSATERSSHLNDDHATARCYQKDFYYISIIRNKPPTCDIISLLCS